MSATVTCLFEGSPPCSWESLLGEGSVSLKDQIPPQSHWSDHWSCNSQCVDPKSSPSYSSWGVVVALSCCIVSLINMVHALKACRLIMSVTYYDVGIESLKSFCVEMICNVIGEVCHGKVCGCVPVDGARLS